MGSVLKAIVWKNLLLRRNHWFQTSCEIAVPLVLVLIVNLFFPPIPKFPPSRNEIDLKCESSKGHDDRILFNPNTTWTRNTMQNFGKKCGFKGANVIPHDITNSTLNFEFGFEFWNDGQLNYTLYPSYGVWPTSLPIWYDETLFGSLAGSRAVQAITIVQNSLESEYLAAKLGNPPPEIMAKEIDIFAKEADIFGTLIILAIFFSYSFLVSPVITRVVEEKESGAKELMRMMGVKSWQLWLAKVFDPLMIVAFVATGMIILMYVPIKETSTVLVLVNPFLFWIVYVMGMLSVVVSLFFISCWFDSPVIAGSVAQMVGMASVIVLGVMQVSQIAWWQRMLYCIFPHITLIYSAQTLLNFEFYGKSVNWTERLSVDGNSLTLSEIFIMMIFDIFFYSILTWYFDNIRPGKFGVPRTWLFFLKGFSGNSDVSPDATPLKQNPSNSSGICIQHLRKVYQTFGKAPVVAVDCVNMEAPEGRITALLGHNGAGKSTTMNIITGLIPATSGTVIINGYDIRLNPDGARSSLGLCPQQDLLFRDLTAHQTLVFFGMIKGMTRGAANDEAVKLLDLMKMSAARDKETQNLSGGMKRKLSLGVAIIGGSKVLILDEPTAGVDAELRREICDLLLSFRGSRTILLTTHIMEEADAICDLINIMDHGLIKCTGTPMDLKNKFGTGYTLQVVIKENDENKVMDVVKANVKDSRFKARNAATLVFQLPSIETPSFPELFRHLDNMQNEKIIESYSISISTLEDVFVRVREIEDELRRGDETDGVSYGMMSSSNQLYTTEYDGFMLLIRQLWALLIKKWLVFSRSLGSFAFFACIPLVLILLSNVVLPQLGKLSTKPKTDRLQFFNYSKEMYPGMEIMLSVPEGCQKCQDFEIDFKTISHERGFHVSNVLNVTKAAYDLFQRDYHQYSRYLALGLELTPDSITVQYNTHATHILPVAVNLINNALLQKTEYRISSSSNFSLIENQDQLPRVAAENEQASSLPETIGFQTLFYMSALHVEKKHQAKNLIILASGSIVYWASHLIFDYLTFAAYAALMSAVNCLFYPDDPIFEDLVSYVLAVNLWGIGMILISYLITMFTKTRANAITIALLIYYVFSYFLWQFILLKMIPDWVGYLHPTTTWKLSEIQNNDSYLLALFIYIIVVFGIIVIIDSKFIGRILHTLLGILHQVDFSVTGEKDSDVLNEEMEVKKAVESQTVFTDKMYVSQLCRFYGLFRVKPAVRGVSFRAMRGDCFGLLGVNGAGKSTTFNMLTAEIARSQGDSIINNQHLSSWCFSRYTSQFSYCPQSSGIIPLLEGQEYLKLFARLRGFRDSQISDVVHNWLKIMDLEECAGKQCGRYSGGMERKLVAAAAFLWDASVVMLDEPTAGVDPVARRCIWKAITSSQENGKIIILTSHSMEECEALCSSLGIMVDGSFRCIGLTTTLKKKFGGGYSVQMKVTATTPEETADFQKAVCESLGAGCRLTDRHCSILHYHILDKTTNWRLLFSKLEELKTQFPIFESYMASETTLEEIFLAFAGHRRPPSQTAGGVHCVDIS